MLHRSSASTLLSSSSVPWKPRRLPLVVARLRRFTEPTLVWPVETLPMVVGFSSVEKVVLRSLPLSALTLRWFASSYGGKAAAAAAPSALAADVRGASAWSLSACSAEAAFSISGFDSSLAGGVGVTGFFSPTAFPASAECADFPSWLCAMDIADVRCSLIPVVGRTALGLGAPIPAPAALGLVDWPSALVAGSSLFFLPSMASWKRTW